MDTQKISRAIDQAKQTENTFGYLHEHLSHRWNYLHAHIPAVTDDGFKEVLVFTINYIESVPKYYQDFIKIFDDTKNYYLLNKIYDITEEYFNCYYNDIKNRTVGLDVCLLPAYYFHRLIEELNNIQTLNYKLQMLTDNFIWDNAVIHEVIGTDFSSKLDDYAERVILRLGSRILNSDLTVLPQCKKNKHALKKSSFYVAKNCIPNKLEALLG